MSADIDYEDYLHALGWLDHTPLPPHPRPDHVGEQVYAEEWQKLMKRKPEQGMDAPNSQLVDILWTLPARINQRHATICASIVCWLGTNCGQAIVVNGKRFLERKEHPHNVYLLAWTLDNVRHSAVNHGLRTLEHLLAPEDHYGKDIMGFGGRCVVKRPEVSQEDYETAEHLMLWLGDQGTGFLLACEQRIKEMEHFESNRRRAEWKRKMEAVGVKT